MSDQNDDAIDWTGPAAEIYDQLIERWFNQHPGTGDEELPLAETYADKMIARYLR